MDEVLLAVDAAVGCSHEGLNGVCKDVSECESDAASYTGHCPGPSAIQCCVGRIECTPGGGLPKGTCIDVGKCGAGSSIISGLCPGSSAIKCCVPDSTPAPVATQAPTLAPTHSKAPSAAPTDTACAHEGLSGSCMDVSTPANGLDVEFYPGHCPGGANNQCRVTTQSCEPPLVSPSVGRCIDTARCTGEVYTGFCPGSSAIRCCIETVQTFGPSFTPTTTPSEAPSAGPTRAPQSPVTPLPSNSPSLGPVPVPSSGSPPPAGLPLLSPEEQTGIVAGAASVGAIVAVTGAAVVYVRFRRARQGQLEQRLRDEDSLTTGTPRV